MSTRPRIERKRFPLAELLAIIAIIILFASWVFPALLRVRKEAKAAKAKIERTYINLEDE